MNPPTLTLVSASMADVSRRKQNIEHQEDEMDTIQIWRKFHEARSSKVTVSM